MPSAVVARPELEPVLALRTKIMALHEVAAGQGVSYGGLWRPARKARVATCPSATPMAIQAYSRGRGPYPGRRAPVVGAVCMDMRWIDVSRVPGASVGDVVTLIGCDAGRPSRSTKSPVGPTPPATKSSAESPSGFRASTGPPKRKPAMSDASACSHQPGNDAGEMTTASVVRLVGRVLRALAGGGGDLRPAHNPAGSGLHLVVSAAVPAAPLPRADGIHRGGLDAHHHAGGGFFTGAVTALQAITALAMFDSAALGWLRVGVSLARELAPVFTAS